MAMLTWIRVVVSILAISLPAVTAAAADTGDARRATQRLFEAVRSNDAAAVQASLIAGADPDAVDGWGVKAVDLAIDKGYYRIAHILAAARYGARNGATAGAADAGVIPAAAPATAVKLAKAAAGGSDRPSSPATIAAAAAPQAGAAISWPADVPNPFDPAQPPPRSQLGISAVNDSATVQ